MDGLLDDLLDDLFNKVSSSTGGSIVSWKGGGDGWKFSWLVMLLDFIISLSLTIFAFYWSTHFFLLFSSFFSFPSP